jgi:Protein of unknown function (DUF3047)
MRRLTQNHYLAKSRVAALLIAAVSAWTFPAAADDCIVLEDFSGSAADSFPSGWTPREKSGSGVYKVIKDGNTQFVRGHAAGPKSSGNGVEADRPVKWDIEQYPVLRWRWRPHVFPRGADEQKGKEDSALGVYIGFCPPEDKDFCERSMRGQLGFGDSLAVARSFMSKGVGSLKYIWSERLPKGLEFERNRKWVKVLESGAPSKPDQWVEERVDVAADYKRRFGAGKLLNPVGLAILTDADDTQSIDPASQAAGDYAAFRICRD